MSRKSLIPWKLRHHLPTGQLQPADAKVGEGRCITGNLVWPVVGTLLTTVLMLFHFPRQLTGTPFCQDVDLGNVALDSARFAGLLG
ncbi:MAG: hypothetical protein WBE26_01925, partial [Phycisphaerae bacterium]